MAIERKSQNFANKFLVLVRTLPKGIKVQYPPYLETIAHEPYISPRAFPNPDEQELSVFFNKFAKHPDIKNNKGALYTLSWDRLVFSKGRYLTTAVSFSDQHKENTCHEMLNPPLARKYVDNVRNSSNNLDRQLTLTEQFAIALELTKITSGKNETGFSYKVLDAAVIAHAGSRAIARNWDASADPDHLSFTKEEFCQWRDCVSTFEPFTGEYGDPPGDTYHFWQNFVAGLTSKTKVRSHDKLLNPVYEQIYQSTAIATELLRHKLASQNGQIHKEADRLGYKMGTSVANIVLE